MRRSLLLFFSLLVILVIHLLVPLNAFADELSLRTEFEYSNNTTETTNKETGTRTESDTTRFTQLYNLDLSKSIYPNLTINGGALYESERSDSTSEELVSRRDEKTYRPHLAFDLRTSLFDLGAGFRKTRITEEISSLPDASNFQKDQNASFTWRPAGLPLVRLFYDRAHNYDDIKTTDLTDESITLKMDYTVLKKHPLNYTYNRNEIDDRLSISKTVVQTHDGGAAYSHSFFKKRLFLDANYKIRYSSTELPSDRIVSSALSPFAGLFSSDDTPQDGPALTVVTALIDGNKTSSSGINLGWSVSGESARNIGLDFGVPVSIDKMFIYVDRNISASAAGAFSWSVYTSPDNTDTSVWTLHATVAPASFGIFQNRFEIPFSEVTTRFIKVVVNPLPAAYMIETELENIFVTEVETFFSTSAAAGTDTIDSVNHRFGFNLRGKVSDRTVIGYNFFYTLRETDPSFERSSISNGVYLNHSFNNVFSLITRVSHDENESTLDSSTDKTITDAYSAMLKAAYLKTFEQILSLSSNEQRGEDGKSTVYTVFLRNNANLYSGWDAYVDIGYSQSKPLEGGEAIAQTVRAGTNVVPHKKINFDMTYSITKSDETDENSGKTSTSNQEFDFRTLFYPYRTLTFFANVNVQDSDEQESRKVFQNYSAGWSPFPDGDLQLFLTYNEKIRSADDLEEKTMGPSLKWNISRYANLDIFYFVTEEETGLQMRDSKTFKVVFTLTF